MRGKPILYRHRIGCLALAVLPTLLVGLVVIGLGYHVQFRDATAVNAGVGWALMGLGVVVSLLSTAALSVRWDLEIDRDAGQVRRTRGYLGMGRSFAYDLSAFDRVEITEETTPDRRGTSIRRYTVRLAGKDVIVSVMQFPELAPAREEAERVESYLDWPVVVAKR